MTPGQAAALADRYADAIRNARTFYERHRPGVRAFFAFHERSALGDHSGVPGLDESIGRINTMRPGVSHDIVMTGQDIGQLALWDQHRQVLAVDPDLWADLGDADDDTVIPEGLFRQLPYPDPFIAFPEPLTLPLHEGGVMTVGGLFLVGRSPFGQCSTHDPAAKSVGLLLGAETYDPSGRRVMAPDGSPDMLWTRVTIGDGATLGEMIAEATGRFVSIALDGDAWREQMPLMVRRAMAAIIYLCAENADLRPVRLPGAPPKRKGARTAKRGRPVQVVEVGFQVGAALRQWRADQRQASGQPTGRTVRPHIRRAHFHTYRVGPGRREARVRWLAPIPINVTGPATRPTVHPVKGEARDRSSV